ncbi:hypothetical protein [Kocuria sp. NPDC057446]|uniref:hypothetical protein n=1 Tax=Kocuria sp. NPDC057446 TaxID=3346137 RepID=UPI0036C23DD4
MLWHSLARTWSQTTSSPSPPSARALFLAEKTVQYHLAHSYGKRGLRPRSELAARYRPPE